MRSLDPSTEDGAKALRCLETEPMGWVTTVSPDGQPRSSPIWFLWRDGDEVLTMEGDARIDLGLPPSSANEAYQAKHRYMYERYG
jgi:hypothetical protein